MELNDQVHPWENTEALMQTVASPASTFDKSFAGASGCSGLSSFKAKRSSARKTAGSNTAKFEKCDKLNAALAAQMAANAKLEAAMQGKLAKAQAQLAALEAAAKIRKERLAKYEEKDKSNESKTKKRIASVPVAKQALADARKKAVKALALEKKLASKAHKVAGNPANLLKM